MKTIRFGMATLVATILLCATDADAQTVIGVKAGINLAEQNFSAEGASVSPDGRTAFVGGGFARFALGSPWFIQPEVLYSSKGWSFEDESLKLDYLEIPVLVGAAFPLENSAIRPSVFAGPMIAFQLSCDAAGADCGDGYETLDFGAVFGAGIVYGTGNLELFLDGRYNLGLADVLADDGEFGDVSVKNRAWQFMAGVGFPVGG